MSKQRFEQLALVDAVPPAATATTRRAGLTASQRELEELYAQRGPKSWEAGQAQRIRERMTRYAAEWKARPAGSRCEDYYCRQQLTDLMRGLIVVHRDGRRLYYCGRCRAMRWAESGSGRYGLYA